MGISKKVREQSQFLYQLNMLLDFITLCRTDLVVTQGEGERTKYQQLEYVRTGKSKTMNSMHRVRCAKDLNFYDSNTGKWLGNNLYAKKRLQTVGDHWESLDKKNRWGGNFKDPLDTPHFERQFSV